MNYLNLFVMIYIGYAKPFADRGRNYIEIVNEIFISIDTYHFMLFSDIVADAETKVQIGWSLCMLIMIHILFNLSAIFWKQSRLIKLILTKYYIVLRKNREPEVR